jgi:quinol-cytochrome oxidoreductase complex cytochrome b subunit
MSETMGVRFGWLRVMYVWTILGAGGFGLVLLFAPSLAESAFGIPAQDPFFRGIIASLYVAFGVLSILGLRSPLKFVPVLFLQLCYKSVWFLAVLLPRLLGGQVPFHAMVLSLIFVTYVVGDLIAIPFGRLFRREA